MKKLRVYIAYFYVAIAFLGVFLKIYKLNIPIVNVTKVKYENISKSINCKGTVNIKQYGIFSAVASDIEEIYVQEGDMVYENSKIAKTVPSKEVANLVAGLEGYGNKLYNNYISAFSNAVNGIISQAPGEHSSLYALPEYESCLLNGEYLYSPANGTVTAVNSGSNGVRLGIEPIAIITDYSDVSVKCLLNESLVNSIRVGQTVKISVSGSEKTYKGQVSYISNEIRSSLVPGGKSTVEVIVRLYNPTDNIINGLSAACSIHTDTYKDAAVLPSQCIFQNDNGDEYVMVYVNGVVGHKKVKCEYYNTSNVMVEGLNKNDAIILNNTELKENTRVYIAEAK